MSDRVYIVDAESLDGGFEPPPVDEHAPSESSHRRGNLRVLVVADQVQLHRHEAAIQAAAGSPLVRSLMVLCEADSGDRIVDAEPSEDEEPGENDPEHEQDATEDGDEAAAPSPPPSSGELPWLSRPPGLARIPILWAPHYLGLRADASGAVDIAGATGHVQQNRDLLRVVLSSESVFDVLHSQLCELSTPVAVPAMTLAYDSRLAGREIADLSDMIIMSKFGRGLEFLVRLTGLDLDDVTRHLAGVVPEQESADEESPESDSDESDGDNGNAPKGERGIGDEAGRSSNAVTPFNARLAALIAEAKERESDRDKSADEVAPEDDGDDPGLDNKQTVDQEAWEEADPTANSDQDAAEPRSPRWIGRQQLGERARKIAEEQAAPLMVSGLLLAGISLLAPVGLMVAAQTGAALLLVAGGYGAALTRRSQNSRPKKGSTGRRSSEGQRETSEEESVDGKAADSDLAATSERTPEKRLEELTEFLGNLLLNALVARRHQPPSPSIVQYDPFIARRPGGISLTDSQIELVVKELDAYLSDLIYRVIRRVFFYSAGADDDEEDASEELLQVRSRPVPFGYEHTSMRPDHPPINKDNRVLGVDKTTRRRLLYAVETGRAPNAAVDQMLVAARTIITQRDRIVDFGLVHAIYTSGERRAEFERRLHTRFFQLTEQFGVLEVFDRMETVIEDYKRGACRLVSMCDLDHLPLIDRSQPMAAVAHARPKLREKLDEWTGHDSGIWFRNADLDGIIGMRPVVSGAVHELAEPWPVAQAMESLGKLHGVEVQIAKGAEWVLVDQLSRYEVVSALDELLERMGDRRTTARLTCERRHDRIVVIVDCVESGDAAALDHWPALNERIDRSESSEVGLRLVVSLPFYCRPGDHLEGVNGN